MLKAKGFCQACYTSNWRKQNPERAKLIARRSHYKYKEKNNNRSKEYYEKHKERLLRQQRIRDLLRIDERRDYNRKYAKDNKEKLAEYYRAWRLAFKYGISIQDYEDLLEQQEGLCAICGEPQSTVALNGKKPLHVDHDHVNGRVRGLLCKNCNTAIGHVEKTKWLEKALNYLNNSK